MVSFDDSFSMRVEYYTSTAHNLIDRAKKSEIVRHESWRLSRHDWNMSENATDLADFVQIEHIQYQWPTNQYPHGTCTYSRV